MEKLVIRGGNALEGIIDVHGAKNSALPILAAAALTGKNCVIHNCPRLTDIDAAVKILSYIGCTAVFHGDTLCVDSSGADRFDIPQRLMHEMRSSIVFLGALLARFGFAELSLPGGCEIGLRPINLHLSALTQMGVSINEHEGKLSCSCPEGLRAAKITLAFPSVGATENIMLAAVSAKGTTTIQNAAREPEIVDLANFLTSCGAKIVGAGEHTVTIEGGSSFNDCEHIVIPDRIVASTYIAAAAVTGGHIELGNVVPSHLAPVLPVFERAGCIFNASGNTLTVTAPHTLQSIGTVSTQPYPGFPTDSQAVIMAMATVSRGISVIEENIFESRFKHVSELVRMGADITLKNNSLAVVRGVDSLHATYITAGDLRGGTALVVAALAAQGETRLCAVHHIDRGCERLEKSLASLGADIHRENN